MTCKETATLLREQDSILILTHKRPDGDTLGCGVALCHALRQLGKTAHVLYNEEISERFAWLHEGIAKEAVEVAFEKLHSHYASYNKSRGIEGSAPLRTRFFDGGHHCSKREQSAIFSFFDEYLKNGA